MSDRYGRHAGGPADGPAEPPAGLRWAALGRAPSQRGRVCFCFSSCRRVARWTARSRHSRPSPAVPGTTPRDLSGRLSKKARIQSGTPPPRPTRHSGNLPVVTLFKTEIQISRGPFSPAVPARPATPPTKATAAIEISNPIAASNQTIELRARRPWPEAAGRAALWVMGGRAVTPTYRLRAPRTAPPRRDATAHASRAVRRGGPAGRGVLPEGRGAPTAARALRAPRDVCVQQGRVYLGPTNKHVSPNCQLGRYAIVGEPNVNRALLHVDVARGRGMCRACGQWRTGAAGITPSTAQVGGQPGHGV